MRIAVIGAGGVGGYFGGFLAKAGHDVAFVARGRHLEAMRADGLALTGPRGDTHLRDVTASDDPAEIGPVDAVLFCVKLYDTESAGARLGPLLGPDTLLVSLQNGVDGPERLARLHPSARVFGGAAFVSAVIAEPGLIRYTSDMSRIVFGALEGRNGGRAEALRDACLEAGFGAELAPDIRLVLWTKMVLLATNAGFTSLARKPVGAIYSDPASREVAAAAMREVAAVARAGGIELAADVVERSLAMIDSFPPGMYASMYWDLAKGGRMELDGLSGLIVARGRELGVPTPVHATIYAALKPYKDGG